MKSVIVGTAGHIDHGKTALVKALTGIDADRLEEEKRRGITIDIGFAHLELTALSGEKLRLGFVDVPGHERFVRNMLAGIGGIDIVLLVIAADESIKPQTREHFDICRLLSVRRGITVLTKADTVDAETLDVVKLEVEEFLRGSFLDPALNSQQSTFSQPAAIRGQPGAQSGQSMNAPAPIIAVSSLTGAGLPELKQALSRIAAEVPAKDSSALARLPIDRVFTMKGFGTVVTGTLVSGTIRKEDELEVFPIGKRVRVRGVQVHGEAAEKAVAGQRTALNLAGVAVEELSRGMTLAPNDTFQTTTRTDVLLSLLPATKPLKDGSRVHFHAHTMEAIAEVRLLETKELKPGQECYAQFRFVGPALLLPGDRFIVRQFSPVVTIGGGRVLDASPVRRNLRIDESLRALASADREEILRARIWRNYHDGTWLQELVSETGWTSSEIKFHLANAGKEGRVIAVGDVFLPAPAWEVLKAQIVPTLADFHEKNRLVAGISKQELQDRSDASVDVVFEEILRQLASEKKIEFSGDLVRLPGRGVVMKDEEAESKKIIEHAFASSGLQVPALYTVLAGLKVDKARAQKIVTLLLRDKTLVKVSEELVFHHSALAKLREQLAAYKAKSTAAGVAKIDVSKFKEMTGVSRKYAIPLLEYLDRERVTRRVGDERVIL
ncbi:MAG: selenocysteine-specific translation elongation factor [Acidobacteriaceae bacterium]|nr:selenocysteine-specific translation elongation factor [Acidobacteriaceae bacterium]